MYALDKARSMQPEQVISLIEKKGLVGRGGAAYPTGKKWRTCRDAPSGEKFIICNADEGEPGTFKDKFIIMHNPRTMIEGILICAYAIGAKKAYVYLRGEYGYLQNRLQEHIDDVVAKSGMDASIEIVRGAGSYVCGERTAIVQSIMGFRGCPNETHPTVNGLWGKPTVINNVETFACAAQAVLYDDWNPDMRMFSLSGNITHPGIYEFPLGVKMSSVIDVARPANKLKAMSFGCFGGIMPVDPDMAITSETICKGNCQHGAYSVIFIDEKQNVVDVSYSIAKFYTYESCGKCTPCREGTIRILDLLKKIRSGKGVEKDLSDLKELAVHVNDTSLCGLGQSAGNHIVTGLEHFMPDYVAYLKKKPAKTAAEAQGKTNENQD